MIRLARLSHLRHIAIYHMIGALPGTEARRIREARLRRIVAAYWVEVGRQEETSRILEERRDAAYAAYAENCRREVKGGAA